MYRYFQYTTRILALVTILSQLLMSPASWAERDAESSDPRGSDYNGDAGTTSEGNGRGDSGIDWNGLNDQNTQSSAAVEAVAEALGLGGQESSSTTSGISWGGFIANEKNLAQQLEAIAQSINSSVSTANASQDELASAYAEMANAFQALSEELNAAKTGGTFVEEGGWTNYEFATPAEQQTAVAAAQAAAAIAAANAAAEETNTTNADAWSATSDRLGRDAMSTLEGLASDPDLSPDAVNSPVDI